MKIILVLGSPNEPDGTLSQMAQGRIEICQKLYKSGACKIVLTGGFGPHFNTTDKPHAHYLKQNLLNENICENLYSDDSDECLNFGKFLSNSVCRYKFREAIH